jgi:hypothetical protein
MELPPPIINEPSDEEINSRLDDSITEILKDQAIKFNTICSDSDKIDLNRVKTKVELAISLWQRSVKTLPIFLVVTW